MNRSQLRQQLAEALGRDVEDELWVRLVDDGHVEDAQLRPDYFPVLVSKARALERYLDLAPAEPVLRRGERPSGLSDRAGALSDVFAMHARARDDVRRFRAEVLTGRLLSRSRVGQWINDHSAGEVPVRDRVRNIAWAPPGATHVRRSPAIGEELVRLADLSEALAAFYDWQLAQATTFVLTDLTPYVPPVRMTFSHRGPLTSRSRFTLSVDPSVTPKELAEHYGRGRKRTLSRQPKALGPKALALAVFRVEHESEDDPRKLLRAWNRAQGENPERQYDGKDVSNFTRDLRVAYERLVEPRWV